ncbi:aldose epimerase family protein [Mucilaginibacter sabulilitoris]|uniref:Aldose 1-epimerase n=1 Tax=Mucilaginibacter sabulilitoris TaxID=1173583 RepID=A0ABZ0TKJ0_9SPHI|nr:aldose epimerase family protein [Mucilaginibacter sabulilitoris]WPU92932.1 aldose epimerase family protein [Mucilaginibacter sabulilitoris]
MSQRAIKITQYLWGEHAGEPVYLFKIENADGAYVELSNYGATLVSVMVPDAHNALGNAVLGFSSLQAYVDDSCYIGSTIGRFANRIGEAKFELDNIAYYLENNEGRNANHGGNNGFNSLVFNYQINADGLVFSIHSKDGSGGYPGNLDLSVHYQWTDLNELIINYQASTDKKTVANFTNHSYFNLSGGDDKIFDHLLTVNADEILESDAEHVPTGVIKPVDDMAFISTAIRNRMTINEGGVSGLNSCYLLNTRDRALRRPAAELYEKKSGRKLEVFTSYPAVIVYTADYLQSEHPGHHSIPYGPFDGLCLECQYYPDSPNHANFPTTVLEPGDTYQETIIYKFSTEPGQAY